ncbi:rhamnulokinase [Microbacterium elymi]|uniref:Rhamnulokinase n=1 Tax=Microbacterium elymi TaxID=2909587 RepID=A0ABY5NIN6_9MICO|nr:rhamnulokinase family protein [Microbacterium elymi]UUT35035.1 rhamnulokinase [Microbacterium elymi]
MRSGSVAAIDLGATSGRVVVGRVADAAVRLQIVQRFENNPVRHWEGTTEALHWNLLEQYRSIRIGLRAALRQEGELHSIAVDSWGVDYGLLRDGALLGNPYHYRDERTARGMRATHELISPEALYAVSGLQVIPINSLYQLADDRLAGRLAAGDCALLIPDLITYWLTGRLVAERTNASTTGLLDVRTREWATDLLERLSLPRDLFPELVEAGTPVGALLPGLAEEIGAQIPVHTVGSHDTASAVVGLPAVGDDFAYVSCGTWALVGVETEHPVLTDAGRRENFTNEGGVDGRTRYLKNIMGLWLQSESIRTWEHAGRQIDLTALLAEAAALPGGAHFDANDPRLLAPGDMPARIAQCCAEAGQPVPQTPAQFVRAINESLADAFAAAVHAAAALSGKEVRVVHIAGGGSQNALLCQLAADRLGLPVIAGPVEATAMGNVLVQARATGLPSGSLDSLRAIVAASAPTRRFEPRTH